MADVRALLLEAARESLGIYPEAVKRGEKWKFRTRWQDGWNAAILGLLTNYKWIMAWLTSLSEDQISAVHDLLVADVLYIVRRDKQVLGLIPMNDVFGYAESDAEEITPIDLPAVARIYAAYGWDGLTAWSATHRDEAPIEERRTDRYYAACSAIRESRQ